MIRFIASTTSGWPISPMWPSAPDRSFGPSTIDASPSMRTISSIAASASAVSIWATGNTSASDCSMKAGPVSRP